jgi:hypothetical protein
MTQHHHGSKLLDYSLHPYVGLRIAIHFIENLRIIENLKFLLVPPYQVTRRPHMQTAQMMMNKERPCIHGVRGCNNFTIMLVVLLVK